MTTTETTTYRTSRPEPIVVESVQLGEYDVTGAAVSYSHAELKRSGGEDFAAVRVRVGVDEWFDEIHVDLGQCGDLDVLERVIGSLMRARDALAGLYDGRPYRVGRCLAVDENGRCTGLSDHERDAHTFPTEEEVHAAVMAKVSLVRQVGAASA